MRLIDADALIESVYKRWANSNEITNGEWVLFREILRDAPTIEAEPVKHGMWQFQYEDITTEETLYECSECGGVYPRYNFCPRCGAMMDGKDEDK